MNLNRDTRMFRAAAVLLCASGLMVSAAMAQQDAPPPPPDGQMQGPPPGGGRDFHGGPEHRLMMLQKHLNLTTDQTAQLKTILDGQMAKAEALRSNKELAPQDRRAQMMAIREDGDTKIHAILTPEQKTKFDEMEAKQREREQEHRRGGPEGPPPNDGSAPPPPAPQP